jgi:hypothetical protein
MVSSLERDQHNVYLEYFFGMAVIEGGVGTARAANDFADVIHKSKPSPYCK